MDIPEREKAFSKTVGFEKKLSDSKVFGEPSLLWVHAIRQIFEQQLNCAQRHWKRAACSGEFTIMPNY